MEIKEEENAIDQGHWIRFVENGRQHKIKCSKCGYTEPEYATFIRNYCPNCGKRMEEEE